MRYSLEECRKRIKELEDHLKSLSPDEMRYRDHNILLAKALQSKYHNIVSVIDKTSLWYLIRYKVRKWCHIRR